MKHRESAQNCNGQPEAAAGPNRRLFLTGTLAGAAALGIWASTPQTARAASLLGASAGSFRNALSVSPFSEGVLSQTALTDGTLTATTVEDLQLLFNAHGATEVYARMATKKSAPGGGGDTGWALGLERAALAAKLKMPFNPELGLFGTYGDTSTYQDPPDFRDYPEIAAMLPAPWTSLTLEQMLPIMKQYTATVARQILDTGAHVNYWDLGNEVDNGISGVTPIPYNYASGAPSYSPPNAVDPAIGQMSTAVLTAMPEAQRIQWSQQHLWPYTAQLFVAAREGILSVAPNAKFSTHIALFPDTTSAVPMGFWTTMEQYGYLPDQLGVSYYPTGPAAMSLPTFEQVHSELYSTFGRKIFIAEYAYPTSSVSVYPEPSPGYAFTEQDQLRFEDDLLTWGVNSGILAGIRYWGPDLCTNEWSSLSLFRDPSNGVTSAKPAIDAVKTIAQS